MVTGVVVLRSRSGTAVRAGSDGQKGSTWVHEDMFFRVVGSGESPGLFAAYRRAMSDAARLRALLVAAELDAETVLVVPSLTEAGEPVVYLVVNGPAGQRLARVVTGGSRPPPDAG